eukprot:1167956_1
MSLVELLSIVRTIIFSAMIQQRTSLMCQLQLRIRVTNAHYHRSIHVTARNALTNIEYAQLMNDVDLSTMDHKQLISFAFTNYHNIKEDKNHCSINILLNVCSLYTHSIQSHKIFNLWSDIIHTNNTNHISHELMTKSCAQMLKKRNGSMKEMRECMQVLEHILTHTTSRYAYYVLMTAYNKNKMYHKVISLYQDHYSLHNPQTLVLALKACKSLGNAPSFQFGEQIISDH